MIKKVLFILAICFACFFQAFAQENQEEKENKWQFGIKVSPSVSDIRGLPGISYTGGIQVKKNIFRRFDISSGLHYSNYNTKFYNFGYVLMDNNNDIVYKVEYPDITLNYLNIPFLVRYNYKHFYGALGIIYDINLGYNYYYLSEADIKIEFENIKRSALELRLAIGYQFNINNKYDIDIDINASAINKYVDDDNLYYYPFLNRLGLGITLYRNFNVNNKKEE